MKWTPGLKPSNTSSTYFVLGSNFGEGDNGALQGGFGGRPGGFGGEGGRPGQFGGQQGFGQQGFGQQGGFGGRAPTNLASILGVRAAGGEEAGEVVNA